MEPIRLLKPPEYTADEREALIDFVLALRKSHIREFLKGVELPVSGTKQELRSKLQEAVKNGGLTFERLVAFLDTVAPWGKQHVFLYDGPRFDLRHWKEPGHVQGLLKKHRLGKLFNARLPLVLPDKLSLSSVTQSNGRLRVTAIQKRDYSERAPDHDEEKETADGEKISLRAYVHHLTRTLVAFEWDLNANAAMLQITQLQRDGDYEEVQGEFTRLVAPWLDVKHFGVLDLRPAIRELHRLEGIKQAEARSHGIQYRTSKFQSIRFSTT